MDWTVRSCEVGAFLEQAGDFLKAAPIKYGMLLSISNYVASKPDAYGKEAPIFLIIRDHKEVIVGVALRTPPFPWSLSELSQEAIGHLFDHIQSTGIDFPGMVGPEVTIRKAISVWNERSQQSGYVDKHMRSYSMEKVEHDFQGKGELRLCTMDDLGLVYEWSKAFAIDAKLPEGPPSKEAVTARVEAKTCHFWEVDGEPRCMIGHTREPLEGVIRVAPVYTPKEHRRKGYGTDATAALSQSLFDKGVKYCSLFTDLANPTSNSIYQKVGYRPVSDFLLYLYEPMKTEK